MAVLEAVNVKVLLFVTGFGERDAVTPLGSPEMDNWTSPAKPYSGFTVIDAVVEAPWTMSTLFQLESVKVGT